MAGSGWPTPQKTGWRGGECILTFFLVFFLRPGPSCPLTSQRSKWRFFVEYSELRILGVRFPHCRARHAGECPRTSEQGGTNNSSLSFSLR